MSCSVVAIPLALQWIYGAIVVGGTVAGGILANQTEKQNKAIESYSLESCDDIDIVSPQRFLEKSFETPFMDKNILLKTLEEHGVQAISETEYGKISGRTGNYELSFERNNENSPYSITVKCLETENAVEKINDLNTEYAINVQEQSYNSIVEKLNENNMEIENEEIYDDNTIVLTVNLE